jgi:OOP family OmpA-OmpF porin
MRLRAVFFMVVTGAAVVAGAWALARTATAMLERETLARLDEALAASGQDWVDVQVDGLVVRLAGEAPDETSRFRALDIARQVVHSGRVENAVTVASRGSVEPPAFALEILRNDAEVSLIGLVPEASGRDAITAALRAGGVPVTVTDMLETVAWHPPAGWAESLRFGLDVIATLPRAKISITPGRVMVSAAMDGPETKAEAEAWLAAARPDGVALTLDLSAPRPVIAPFRASFSLSEEGATLSACTAETEEDAERILEAARAAGLAAAKPCDIGLGAPSPDWAEAVGLGIAAVAELGGGRFEITDIDAVLIGPPEIESERLAAAGDRLAGALPELFSLETRSPPAPRDVPEGTARHMPEFRATLLPDGTVRLIGTVFDSTSRVAIEGVAEALFGHDKVTNATVLDPDLPDGWPGRVLAGVEALALLKEGTLVVTGDRVQLSGTSLVETAATDAETLLAAKAGGPAEIAISFDADAAALLARPKPELCAAEIDAILAGDTIRFAPSSSEIESASLPVIDAIAEALRACPGARFEIAGHTDSRGRAEMNLRISEERAEAVLTALASHDLPLVELSARGYGSERPIADNASEEGRALNRRIEFRLLSEDTAETKSAAAPDDGQD